MDQQLRFSKITLRWRIAMKLIPTQKLDSTPCIPWLKEQFWLHPYLPNTSCSSSYASQKLPTTGHNTAMNHNVFQILLNGPKYLGAIDSYSSFLFPIVVLLAFELSKNHNIMIANVFMEIHYQMRQYKNCN